MSIKRKILIIVAVFGLLISIFAGSIIRSYSRARHQVNVLGATLDILTALMQTRLAVISRISLSMDYILTGQARQKRDQEELKRIAEDSFREWVGSIERYMSLVPGEEEEMQRFRRIEKEYGILHGEIERAISLAEEGKREEAYRLLEGTELDHSMERTLAEEFSHAEIKERREFEESYQDLVMSVGVIPWWGDGGESELKRARFLFHDFLAANKAYTVILMQYRELIDYLVSAEEEEKDEYYRYGVLVGVSLDEWEAIQDTYSDHASGGDGSRDGIGNLRRRYNEFLLIAGRVISLREQGEREGALALWRKLPALHDNFFSTFLNENENSTETIEAAYQNMLRSMYSADRGAMILLVMAGSAVLFVMTATVRGIFRPLDMLRRGTELLGQGRLDYRIALNRDDELGQLSASFDSMAASLEADITRRKEMERLLQNSEHQLRLLSSHILDVQEMERLRISRELHDDLGQSLALLKLRTGSLARSLGEDEAGFRNELLGVSDFLDGIIEKTRRISQELEPSVLEDLGLTTAVRRLLEEFSQHYDARCGIDIEEMDDLIGNRARLVIYRILQEALTNIAKHSHASEVSCTVRRENQAVQISIEDNGDGFDLASVSLHEGSGRGMGLMTRLALTVPADKRGDG
jgi:signal transduction histidine kinase